jgi:CheY-like chemotaxis protein
MNSGAPPETTHGPASSKRAWILGGAFDTWWEIALALRQWGIEAKPVGPDADISALAEQAELEGGVFVVDLLEKPDRGIGIIKSCQSISLAVPIISVSADPSVELAQRLRDLGVFCLAVHPLDPAKMRNVLEDAFRHIEHMRAAALSGKRKILIIDDDPDYRKSVQALLENEGYEVICATTGAEGLEMAVSHEPDLIILDVMMENLWAGYEVNQTLKFRSGYESVRKAPIVMVSSIEAHPAERFARSEDASKVCPDVYLTKPLDVARFLTTVRSLLAMTPSVKVRS